MKKADQKAADKLASVDEVMIAIGEARDAAEEAFNNFAKTAQRTKDGFIADTCGGAYVYACKPSYAFRVAMLSAGAIEKGSGGKWQIGRFQSVGNEQSVTAAEVACKAALRVLVARFPDETLYMNSYVS